VLHEAREQLVRRHGDGAAVLGAEGDTAVVEGGQSLVGDTDAVGVTSEIADDLLVRDSG
jgi:hypothetical protein